VRRLDRMRQTAERQPDEQQAAQHRVTSALARGRSRTTR
jgi:hypothetical protein